jgi:hypothetical protein
MSFVPGCVDHADLHVLIDQDGVSIRVGDHDVVVVLHDQPVLRLVSCERGKAQPRMLTLPRAVRRPPAPAAYQPDDLTRRA